MTDPIRLVKGSVKPFDVFILDDNDVKEDLSTAEAATLVIKESIDAATNVVLRRTTDGNLSIDEDEGKVTGTLTQGEANALTPGSYVGEVAVRLGATDWFHTDPFIVVIEPSAAPHS